MLGAGGHRRRLGLLRFRVSAIGVMVVRFRIGKVQIWSVSFVQWPIVIDRASFL